MPAKKSAAVVRSRAERERLFHQHEKLAYAARHNWARKNSTFIQRYRLDMDDLDSVALLALWYATEVWNPAKGKFSTIAMLAISSRLGHVLQDLSRQRNGGGCLPPLSFDAPANNSESAATFLERMPAPAEEQPERALLRHEEAGTLWEAVGTLPQAQQDALRLRYVDGLTQREVGERVGTSHQTVSVRLAAGLSKLRKAVVLS